MTSADADPLAIARALNRASAIDERDDLEQRLVAALRGPRVARPWLMPDGSHVAVLRDALAAWREAARRPGRPRKPRVDKPPRPDRTTVAVMLRLTPAAAERLGQVPSGGRGRWVSALIEGAEPRSVIG